MKYTFLSKFITAMTLAAFVILPIAPVFAVGGMGGPEMVSCDINTAPEIRLTGPESMTIDVGEVFTDPGAVARDAEDGNITSSIEVRGEVVDSNVPGNYNIKYGVYDSCGALSEILNRQVMVREPVVLFNNAPTISLIGASPFFVELGEMFVDPGIEAFDLEDGGLENERLEIISRGNVNTEVEGVYRVRYGVKDTGEPTGERKIDTTKRVVVVQDTTSIVDLDEDGIDDEIDNCPLVSNPDQEDTDEDGVGDACEDGGPKIIDNDEDGVDDEIDNCPGITNPDQADTDEDGRGDACDGTGGNEEIIDTDEDGIDDEIDNCPLEFNPDQADSDEDGTGDECERRSSGGGSSNNSNDEDPDGEVLGEFAENTDTVESGGSCDYISTYLKLGKKNDAQDVKDLQNFLNETEGESLIVDGDFGPATDAAVRRLQEKYKDEILAPWGLNSPTGYVYILTQWFINNSKCGNLVKPIV